MSEESKATKTYKWLVEHMTSKGLGSTLAKIAAGAIIGILAALGLVSCSNLTSEQVQTAHDLYHKVTNKPCVFMVEELDK